MHARGGDFLVWPLFLYQFLPNIQLGEVKSARPKNRPFIPKKRGVDWLIYFL